MANVAGGDGGRTGPYWRRQMGTTLPGERTGAQLQLINRLRARQGLDPLGGMVGEDTRYVLPNNETLPSRQIDRRRHVMPAPGGGLSRIPEQPFDEFSSVEGNQAMPMIREGLPAIEDPNDVGGIRERLLRQFTGNAPMQHSREALLHFLQQQQQRKAVPMPGRRARPILPPRQPLRRVQPARPY